MLDAASLTDLADVSLGDATITTRAALYQWGVTLLIAYVYGDIDDQTYIDKTEDLMSSVAFLNDTETDD